jgi:hypothetical protein
MATYMARRIQKFSEIRSLQGDGLVDLMKKEMGIDPDNLSEEDCHWENLIQMVIDFFTQFPEMVGIIDAYKYTDREILTMWSN